MRYLAAGAARDAQCYSRKPLKMLEFPVVAKGGLIGPMPVWLAKPTLNRLTEQRLLPRNRLLAGRFRPALRFATRGPSFQA
jgi:hypothetical protein